MLEVGCGSNPLVAFAALRHCQLAVCTDGSSKTLELMDSNIACNARCFLLWTEHQPHTSWAVAYAVRLMSSAMALAGGAGLIDQLTHSGEL